MYENDVTNQKKKKSLKLFNKKKILIQQFI